MTKEITLDQFKTYMDDGDLHITYTNGEEYYCHISVRDMSLIFNPDFDDRNFTYDIEWEEDLPANWDSVEEFIRYNLSELRSLSKLSNLRQGETVELALKTYIEDDLNCNKYIALVSITPQFAKYCLDWIEHVRKLHATDSEIFELTIFNENAKFIKVVNEEVEQAFDLILEDISSEMLLKSIDGSNDIDGDYFIHHYEESPIHNLLHISKSKIYWSGTLRESGVTITTTHLSEQELRSVWDKKC